MGRILPAFYQFFDDSGDPLSLGWLRFLEPSTNNTDKNTYADENLTVANANPLRLDAAGRMPDAFGTGKYRVVSFKNDPDDESNPGEQVQVKDPVQAEGTVTGGAGGGFEAWDTNVTYQLNDIVEYNNLLYRSLIVDNLGNNPSIETYAWEQIDFIRYWNETISYTVNELVYYSGNLYLSLQTTNLNHIPSARLDYWLPVATGAPEILYKDDNYEIIIDDIYSIVVLSSATLADKIFTLPAVTSYHDRFVVWIANESDYNLSITAQLTADIWLEDPVIIQKGSMARLQYSGAEDHWHVSGVGPALGAQNIGTTTNPVVNAYIDGADIDTADIAGSLNLADDISIFFGNDDDADIVFTSATPALDINSAENIFINLAAGKSLTVNVDGTDHWIFDSTGPLLRDFSNPQADIGSSSEYIDDIFCETINIYDLQRINFNTGNDLTIFHNTASIGFITNNTGDLRLTNTAASGAIEFYTNGTQRWIVASTGHLYPATDSTYDIGTTSVRVDTIYCDSIDVGAGASGTIDTTSSQTITVVNGIITSIV